MPVSSMWRYSVDGKDAESHDTMRGVPGAFDRAIAGIKNSVAAGFYTCMATTVTRANYDQVPEIYSLASDLGVNRLMCFNFIPTGRGAEMQTRTSPRRAEGPDALPDGRPGRAAVLRHSPPPAGRLRGACR